MTFLPIVERELRVAARRRGTYWTRSVVALFAILISVVTFLVSYPAPPHEVGEFIFIGLAILCLIYCVFSGRGSTADCLSEEKREGTLGLLFLTDLKGYDVVLGKLVSTSLGALYALLAVLPVLALPLLMGGVTNGEFWRVVLALMDTFLFSLAIGIFGSAISRESRRAMAANFALAFFFMAALPFGLMGAVYYINDTVAPTTLLTCPGFTLYLATDTQYKLAPEQYWYSVAAIGALTILLLALACRIVPRTWQDKPVTGGRHKKATWRGFWRAINYGKASKLPAFRKSLLDRNAFLWLAGRARLKPLHVWIFLGLMGFWWVLGWAESGMLWFDPATAITLALILNGTLKAWIAVEGGQQLAEDQRTGAFELILATPLTARDIVGGQYLALTRQFLKPLVLTLVIEIFLMVTQYLHANSTEAPFDLALWLAGISMLVADVVTLPMVAMRRALTAKNPARATLGTVSLVLILPWALFGLAALIAVIWVQLFSPMNQTPDFLQEGPLLGIWFGLGIIIDLFFGLRAWRQLSRHFRQLATRRFAPTPRVIKKSIPLRQRLAAFRPSRRKIITGGVVLVLIGGYFLLREEESKFPPPVEVSILRKAGPLRIFPGWSSFFILPDGSLWHWGSTGNGNERHEVPMRIGTNENWRQTAGSGRFGTGLQKNGTIWRWGSQGATLANPEQIGSDTTWTAIGADYGESAGIRKDGTLWKWDFSNRTPSQIGTDSNWTAVTGQEECIAAIKANGTLWIWGRMRGRNATNYDQPAQVCSETNWAAVTVGSAKPWAWTASGEVWQLDDSRANPQTSILNAGDLLASNTAPDHLAAAYVGRSELFEVRADGTLWEKDFTADPSWYVAPADAKWRQTGQRSDWQAVWGNGGTAFGLTADGILWTWGLDSSRDGTWSASTALRVLQMRIKNLSRGRSQPYQFGRPTAVQKTPRPLIHLIDSGSAQVNQ